MRIGLVSDFYYPWVGGPSTLVRNLGHGLVRHGHEVFLLAPSVDGPGGDEEDGAMSVTRASTVRSPFGYKLRVSARPGPAVSAWLDRIRPDVVQSHHPFPLSAAAVFAARRRAIPVSATNHTIPACSLWGIRHVLPAYAPAHAAFGRWITFLLGHCTTVATPTETAAESLRSLGFHRDVHVISNGVDTDRFAPGPPTPDLRSRLGLDARPVVLYTGRLDAEKEMGVWLEVAARLAVRRDVQFVVGGKGTDRPRLEALARNLQISDRVRFVGYVGDDEFPDLYRLADVYFITSPVELQSLTTLEAIASGVPIVGVNAGALPELVLDGENGFCPPSGDIAGLTRALDAVLGDANQRSAMGARGRAIALRHDLGQSISAYERLLTSTARMGAGASRERAAFIRS